MGTCVRGKTTGRIGLIFVAVVCGSLHAQSFTLTGTQTKDVTTRYASGTLYDSSLVRILPGSSIMFFYAYDTSTANISGGDVSWVEIYNTSTANISGGNVSQTLSAHGDGTVNIFDGNVNYLYSLENSTTTISGGSVNSLPIYGTSKASIFGGDVGSIRTNDTSIATIFGGDVGSIRTNDTSIATIFGGNVDSLSSVESSTSNISGGNVNKFYVYDASIANISGGNVSTLYTYSTSTTNISDGSINTLNAYDLKQNGSQHINITGGMVSSLSPKIKLEGNEHLNYERNLTLSDLVSYGVQALPGTVSSISPIEIYSNETSTATISGGYLERLYARDLKQNGPQRITITGGTVSNLRPEIRVDGNEHINYERDLTLADLASYGVQASQGTVSSVSNPIIYAYETSTVTMSGGNVQGINVNANSTVNISGGNVNYEINAYDNSTVKISGGKVNSWITAYNNSTVKISGGNVNSLFATDTSSITFIGFDFVLGQGLSWGSDGQTILGRRGIISGKWYGSSNIWGMYIAWHASTATIRAIPEPATLLLLSFGGIGLMFCRRK